jgi:hypothetical protein
MNPEPIMVNFPKKERRYEDGNSIPALIDFGE